MLGHAHRGDCALRRPARSAPSRRRRRLPPPPPLDVGGVGRLSLRPDLRADARAVACAVRGADADADDDADDSADSGSYPDPDASALVKPIAPADNDDADRSSHSRNPRCTPTIPSAKRKPAKSDFASNVRNLRLCVHGRAKGGRDVHLSVVGDACAGTDPKDGRALAKATAPAVVWIHAKGLHKHSNSP